MRVQSGLGHPLRASVTLLGGDANELELNCVKARIESSDNIYIATPRAALTRDQVPALQLTTAQTINEPAVSILVSIGCATPIQRTYQMLLDPAVVLPVVAQSQQSTRPVEKAIKKARVETQAVVQPAADALSAPETRKRGASRLEKKDQTATEAIADIPPKKRDAALRSKEKKVTRNVLRLSGDETLSATQNIDTRLKMTDSLSVSSNETDPQKIAELRAAQAELTALLRDENLLQNSHAKAKAIQAELQVLKAETDKLKQQSQADKEALVTIRSTAFSSNWIVGLGALLLVCFCAIAWLLWRFYDLQKTPPSTLWGENVAKLDEKTTGLAAFESNSEFSNTAFGVTVFGDTEFGDTVPVETECDKITQSIENLPTIIDLNPSSEFIRDDSEVAPAPQTKPIERNHPSQRAGGERLSKLDSSTTIDSYEQAGARPPGSELALKAEEIADVMQLAELWVSLNDPMRAIQILEPHSDVEQPDSPAPWIYLLDLYRVVGDQVKYENIQTRIERVFNAKISRWDEESSADVARTLEDYPHIVEAICARWDGNDIVPYLENLLLKSRDQARIGFDLAVYRDIIQLISLASEPDPMARYEHMAFGQGHAILFRKREQAVLPTAGADAPSASEKVADTKPADSKTSSPPTARSLPPLKRKEGGLDWLNEPEIPLAKSTKAPIAEQDPGHLMRSLAIHVDDEDSSVMATKLHLAIAYQDIGEKDGARLLLEEVIRGGTPDQSEKARLMLAILARTDE